MLACACFRLWIARDTVSSIKPDDSIISIQFLKTPANIELLHQNLGSSILIPNSGITWDNAILMSNREFAIHIDSIGRITGLTLDTNISDEKRVSLEQFGLFVNETKGRTIISKYETSSLSANTHIFTLIPLWPFFDGHISGQEEKGYLQIKEKGLVLHGFGEKSQIKANNMLFPDTSTAISQISSTQEALNTNVFINNLYLSPISTIAQTITSNIPWLITLYVNDIDKLHYSILIENKFSTEELANLAKELVQSSNLSTLALTMDDSTQSSEIIATYNNPDVSISTEQGSTFIHAYTENNEIHLTQTATRLYITSTDSSLISAQKAIEPICDKKAHSYIDLDLAKSNINLNLNGLFINEFSSTAISNQNIYFCW